MKIIIGRKKFLDVLSQVQDIVAKEEIMPILAHILVEAVDDFVKITATNLEVSYMGICDCRVVKKGKMLLHAKKLYEILKVLPEGDISLEKKENNWVNLEQDNIKYNLMCLSTNEFPVIRSYEKDDFFVIEREILGGMIDKTLFAVADVGSSNYNISGAFLEKIDKNVIRMVGTDGRRLSLIDKGIQEKNDIPLKKGVIIPKKGVRKVKSFLDSGEKKFIFLRLEEKAIIIKDNIGTLVVNLIMGHYPDYRSIISGEKSCKSEFLVYKSDLISALKRVSILTEGENYPVKLDLEKNKMTVHSESSEFGNVKEEIEIVYSNENISFCLNAFYLLDVLRVIEGEQVKFLFSGNEEPLFIRDSLDDTFLSIIMPIKL